MGRPESSVAASLNSTSFKQMKAQAKLDKQAPSTEEIVENAEMRDLAQTEVEKKVVKKTNTAFYDKVYNLL